MTSDTFVMLAHAVRNSLPRIAGQMNVFIDDAVADELADTIVFAMDESTSANICFQQEQEATMKLTQLIGSHLRTFYFLQVGAQLGATLARIMHQT